LLTASFDRHPTVTLYKDKLKEYLDQREEAVFNKNEEMASGNNEELLRTLAADLKDKLSKGFYDEAKIELYSTEFQNFITEYDEQATGANKLRTLLAFLNTFNKVSLQSIIGVIKKNLYKTEN